MKTQLKSHFTGVRNVFAALALFAALSPLYAASSAPTPYIEAPRMQYQLESQTLDLVPQIPEKNSLQQTPDGKNNPDYAYISSLSWEVATNGSNWRKIGTQPADATLYSASYFLTIYVY